jgi:coiled-coil domain-containing protein 55
VKALEEDPSIFDYDAAYDEMAATKVEHPLSRSAPQEKQSRYVQNIMQMTNIRQREHDRAYERRKLKELEQEEAEQGPTTEKFVTSAYKKKLLEDKKWELEEQREEAEGRSAAKLGMQGFYASLLTKNVAMGGDVKEAVSAYTVGSSRAAAILGEEGSSESGSRGERGGSGREQAKQRRPDSQKRPRSPSSEADRVQRPPDEEIQRIEREALAMREAEAPMRPPAARPQEQPSAAAAAAAPAPTPAPASKMSKEEMLAAARERALKRKLEKAGAP